MKFKTIYADPPWRYDFSKSDSRQIENQYQTMALEDIERLPIANIIEVNAILYLWATAPKLIEALQVMRAWGFTYKTNAIWDKEVIGMGYWFRGQHELLLVGTHGSPHPPEQAKRISSVIQFRRTIHSMKPPLVADFIDQWYPNQTKIELFARQDREGWTCLGDELNGDIYQSLYEIAEL